MNPWYVAATALMIGLVPCGIVIARGTTAAGLAALQLAGTIATMVLLLLAVGSARASSADVALALAVLAYPASLVFAHFLEKWL